MHCADSPRRGRPDIGDAVTVLGDVAHTYANPGTAERGGRDKHHLELFLAGGRVDPAVFALRPDYRVVLIAVDGVVPGASDATSEALLRAAEERAGHTLAAQ